MGFAAVLFGCIEPRPREPDPWERYVDAGVPAGNVRVRVEAFEFAAEDRAAFDLALRYRDPSVAVSAGSLGGSNGLTLWAGTPNFLAAFRAESSRFRSRRATTQFVVVADGHEGSFQSFDVQAVPVLRVIPVYRGALVVRTIQGLVTGAGMAVRPRVLPDGRIDLELEPWLAVREGANPKSVRVTELATRVVVEAGRPVVLAAQDETRDTLASVLLGSRSATTTRRTLLVLVAEK